MSTEVRVRPSDREGTVWVVDYYDGRGGWKGTSWGLIGRPWDKRGAQRQAKAVRKRIRKIEEER